MVTLIIQRIASFAIRIKMNSKTTPPIMKMVVKVMVNQLAVISGQWPVVSKSVRLVLFN